MNGLAAEANVTVPVLPGQVTVVSQVLRIPLNLIRPFAGQPRETFDPQKLNELAASLNLNGQITPAIVKKLSDDPTFNYELVAGERRLRAAKIAGINFLDAVLEEHAQSVQRQFEKSAIENLSREGHTTLETLAIMVRFRDGISPARTPAQVAQAIGWSEQQVSRYFVLEKMSPVILQAFKPETPKEQHISLNQAIALAPLSLTQQELGYANVWKHKMSVPQIKMMVKNWLNPRQARKGRAPKDPSVAYRDFVAFARDVLRQAEAFSNKSASHYEAILKPQPAAQRRRIIEQLDNATFFMDSLVKALKKVQFED